VKQDWVGPLSGGKKYLPLYFVCPHDIPLQNENPWVYLASVVVVK
jgi:hypothetical protein